jgi:hypothetical protein
MNTCGEVNSTNWRVGKYLHLKLPTGCLPPSAVCFTCGRFGLSESGGTQRQSIAYFRPLPNLTLVSFDSERGIVLPMVPKWLFSG